ncbi:phage portal protein [Gryllotalpicola koreensis]|uniref:Portal protein n=1 Tax=Gryllotalpicola koreensis TaxID=993086 RepID=A0ABP8A1T8_9MICO
MPLPADNAVWPPRDLERVFRKYAEWNAWYSGTVNELRGAYGVYNYLRTSGKPNQMPELRAWNFMGRLANLFWGRPLEYGETRTVLHVPVAADLAQLSSSLLFAEPPEFTVEDKNAQTRLDLMLNSPDVHMLLQEQGESTAAFGGTYWTPQWDLSGDAPDHVWMHGHNANTAVPEFAGSRLKAVTFWTRYDEDRTVYRHLERHEQGAIIHGLYKGDWNNIGARISFDAIPETAHLSNIPGAVYPGDNTCVITVPLNRLHVAYQPNVRPNGEFMGYGNTRWLGRSDYSGIEPTLNAIDETWSSWMADLKAGKSRLFVNSALMKSNGPGRGARFNAEQDVFTMIDGIPDQEAGKNIQSTQFDIRVQEHEQTVYNLVKVALRHNGYSLSSYGEAGDIAQTATEVMDRKTDSELTRDKKKRYASAALNYMGSVMLELDSIVYPGQGSKPGLDVASEFPETSQEDPLRTAQIIQMLDAASSISLQTRVERANPGWTEEQILEEVDRIKAETPNPMTLDIPSTAAFQYAEQPGGLSDDTANGDFQQ